MRKIMQIGLVALALGLLSTACVDPITVAPIEEEQTVESNLSTITATLEDATKTSLSGLNVLWQTGDAIKVFNASTPAGEVYTLSDGAGTTKATFTGNPLSGTGPYYAVYPASAATGLTSTTISLTIPDEQTYAANSFGPGANLSWATHATSMDNLTFKNAGGALRLTISGDKTINTINLYSIAGEPLSGKLTMNVADPENPVFTPVSVSNCVSLDCGGVSLGGGSKDFYIIVPAGVFAAGFQVEIIDSESTPMGMLLHTTNDNRVPRSGIRAMPEFAYVQQYKSGFLTATSFAGAWGNVAVSGTISGKEYIDKDLAGQYAIITGSPKGLRFQNWSEGYAITLTPSTSTSTLKLGDALTIDVVKKGANTVAVTDRDDLPVTVIKKVNGRSWLYDATNGTGYIITDAVIQ